MKILILILLLVSPLLVRSQGFFNIDNPCGKWVPDTGKLTDWQSVDTVKKPVTTSQRNWVEDIWKTEYSQYTYAVFAPCGMGLPDVKFQYRICSITGIRQKRYFVVNYHYIEPEKSQYEKTIEQLKQ